MPKFLLPAALMFSTLAVADVGVAKVNSVTFMAVGPAGFKINGTTQSLEAKPEGDSVVLRVPLDTVGTGIELRDKHMKEKYLETKTHPMAELKVAKSLLKEGKGQHGTGTFSVHGTSKEVAITYDAAKADDGFVVNGQFDINIKEHAIDVPSYMGVTVKPEVKVVASFVVKP